MQIELELDPTGYYEKNCGPDWYDKILGALGMLPSFLAGPHESLAENMEGNYMFFSHWSEGQGATVTDQCFCFPQDPPQQPLMSATHGNEIIYIYQNCIVAQVLDGKLVKWTRMD